MAKKKGGEIPSLMTKNEKSKKKRKRANKKKTAKKRKNTLADDHLVVRGLEDVCHHPTRLLQTLLRQSATIQERAMTTTPHTQQRKRM